MNVLPYSCIFQSANDTKDGSSSRDDDQKQHFGAFFGCAKQYRQPGGIGRIAGQFVDLHRFGVAVNGVFQEERHDNQRQEQTDYNYREYTDFGGSQADYPQHEGGKGLLRLDHSTDGDFLLIAGSIGLFQHRAGDAAGGVDISQNIVDSGNDNCRIHTNPAGNGNKDPNQGIGETGPLQQSTGDDAADDRPAHHATDKCTIGDGLDFFSSCGKGAGNRTRIPKQRAKGQGNQDKSYILGGGHLPFSAGRFFFDFCTHGFSSSHFVVL